MNKAMFRMTIIHAAIFTAAALELGLAGCSQEASGSEETSSADPGGPGPMVDLEPMVVNLSNTDRSHYLKVSVSLELTDEAALQRYEPRKVQARHAVLMTLRSLTLAETQDVDEQERIRDRLRDELSQVVGSGTIKSVYFTDFVTQ